ncbi:hypothetical protein ACFQJ5_06825 [Halomicroarcula sp. GCM10025324]|uniref:hypothetical protein n=1 Tax=Haloarcula TaxID=2237 RepID=UPI0023E81E96|nr:hypothetical protein [Halomicroarcula sp. ZS-22-S1]
MGRLSLVGWSLLVSVWAGIVGGVAVYIPSLDVAQLYTVGFQLVAWPAAYWTMREHRDIFDDAHRPGRLAMFILVFFFATVSLATVANLALGHTSLAGILVQLATFVAGLATALYVAYGGGFDWAWETYT